MDVLAPHTHRRQDTHGPLADLHLELGHSNFTVCGRPTGAASPNWCKVAEGPFRRDQLTAFVFGLRYSEKTVEDDTSRSKAIPFHEVADLFQRLPLSGVTKAWLSMTECLPKIDPDMPKQCNNLSLWRSVLSRISNVHTLRHSRGVLYGVLRALTSALQNSAPSPDPAEAQATQRLELESLTELMIDARNRYQHVPVPEANAFKVARYLYRYIWLRYQMLLPLQTLRHDLCASICSSETAGDRYEGAGVSGGGWSILHRKREVCSERCVLICYGMHAYV